MLRHSPPLLTSCARVERTLLGRGGNQDLRRANRKRFGAANWTYTQERAVLGKSYPTLRQARPRGVPEAAMRVRKISAQCVLQFTPSLAAGCVLHRPVSRVIHCSELYCFLQVRDFSLALRFVRDCYGTLPLGAMPGEVRRYESTKGRGSRVAVRRSGRTNVSETDDVVPFGRRGGPVQCRTGLFGPSVRSHTPCHRR